MNKVLWVGVVAFAVVTADAGKDGDSGGGDTNASMCGTQGTPGTHALAIGIQLRAQPSLSSVLAARNGEAGFADLYDVDATREAISDYRVLDGHHAGVDSHTEAMGEPQDLIMSQRDVALAVESYCF